MNASLEESYAHCRAIARRTAGNFYYSFLVLPRAKRRAMCALYAFLRETDDLGDSDLPADQRAMHLRDWRRALDAALAGHASSPVLAALADTAVTYSIPPRYLYEAIEGVEMDLTAATYETFADLQGYCYKVASVVGLACLHIWGFSDVAALSPACDLGVAFQLTNILRDLKEDAERGRVYLPQEDLRRFGYGREDLDRASADDRFLALMQFEIARAEEFYRRGAPVERWLSRDSRAALRAMTGIYHGLLGEIRRRPADVLTTRVRLSSWRKLSIAARSLVSLRPMAAL